jgi:serine/threonine protein kinase
MRDVNAKDSEATYIYQTDDLTVQQWRDVMRACQAYEKFLLDGQKITPEDFAFRYAEIPTHLLIPELIKIHSELLEHPLSRSLDCESTPSPSERYLILEEIRSGGMGQVFRAFDRACGRLVAIKRIRKELAQEPLIRQRFLAEVELTADLEHPGVIPVYNQSVDSFGREFYVMRLIHGKGTGTLQQAIQRFHSATFDGAPKGITRSGIRNWNPSKRAAFRKLIESVLVIVDTTAHAHSRGIAHRDLKPSNVLVGPFGETLIADWGLAKRINLPEPSEPNLENNDLNVLQSNLSKDNQSNGSLKSYGVGTPGFRAPETQSGSATTNLIAADIYSLGAILECVISGVARHTNDASFRKIKTPGPTAILPLIAIARKAMSGEVANRYPHAQSMGRDLSNWLAGEPVSAYPESLAERVLLGFPGSKNPKTQS